jgi:hypothetical protein
MDWSEIKSKFFARGLHICYTLYKKKNIDILTISNMCSPFEMLASTEHVIWRRETLSATASLGPGVFVLRAPPVISDVSLNTKVNISRGYVPRESLVKHGLTCQKGSELCACFCFKWLYENIERTVSTGSMK